MNWVVTIMMINGLSEKRMDLMKIYNKSPIVLQNIMTTLQGMVFKKQRFGEFYKTALREYSQRSFSNRQEIEDYQWDRCEELIRYAVKNSEFYKSFYSNIDIDNVIESRDLSMLPILEKELVRENIESLYTIDPALGISSNTSGTTGKSIKFIYTKEDFQRRLAYLDFFKMQFGYIPFKMKRASFNSAKIIPPKQKRKIFWRDNLAINQRIYSGYHCKGDNCKYYVDNLNKYKPESLDGYPSALYELSKYIIDNDVHLTFTPLAIFPTAETLLPHYRTSIEKAFGCKVLDQYASSEGAPFITECNCGHLHYCVDTGVIEFMSDGRMLVTCFETHGTPLIRYDIGDKAYLSETNLQCECGTLYPIVDRIEGRSADYLLSPTNGKFTSIYLSLVSGVFSNSVKSMQFIQNKIDSVDVYIVVDKHWNDNMNQIILDKLHYSLGESMKITIHKVNELQKDPSGKTRFIINNVQN